MKYPILFAAPLLFAACDKVEDPLGNSDAPPVIIAGEPRRVLLEDCTGHTCNNCPEAAVIAEQLKAIYGDKLVVVAVHMVAGFAAPVPPIGDGQFDTDFRTTAGNAYESAFNILSLPKGLVSRKPFENAIGLSRSKWSSATAAIIGQEAEFKLWFDTIAYDQATNSATIAVKALCVKPVTGNHSLTIYLIEDNVVADQLDLNAEPDHVTDYVHKHVLRDNVNGTWGEPFVTGSTVMGDTLEASYTYTLSANVLQPANCSLVAYIHSTAGASQYEVKQVVEAKLIP